MTKIKQSVALSDTCSLTVTDTSGFFDAGTNPYGFLKETNADALTLNVYKISHGYFLNVLLYNKYACTPIVSNPSDTMYSILSGNVDNTTYANNFPPNIYSLTQDGTYTLRRYFIPSQTFYNTNKTNPIYSGITMFYTDGDQIFKIIDNAPQAISITSLLNTDLSTSNVIFNDVAFISTCYMNICYFKILSTILDIDITACVKTGAYADLIQKRDLLYMTFETIKYLKEQNNITQIQKLIEVMDICGGICASTLRSTSSTNCGCNG